VQSLSRELSFCSPSYYLSASFPALMRRMMKPLMKLNNRGQGMVEYLIIVALMGVATMCILRVTNKTVQVQFANIARSLGATGERPQAEQLNTQDYSKKDMTNFFHNSR
jgi:pilus assembly protein Flp/PilA